MRRTSMPDFVPDHARPPAISSMALGMTEACSCHTNFDPYVPLDESKRGTFGPSIEGLEHKIIDPGTGGRLPPGKEGEICVRGYSMMLGRQKVERQDTFDADGWYHTGDIGYRDEEGYYFIHDRVKNMIKSGGENIYPAEVERVLHAHPDIVEVAVIGLPDEKWQEFPVAVVVPVKESQLTEEALHNFMTGQLAGFKIPRRFIFTSELPKNAMGKVQHFRLREQIQMDQDLPKA
jgi:fatty-acyl-CoA synthase